MDNQIDPKDREKFEMAINLIQQSILILQDVLPDEQSHVGSDLQQVDMLVLQLIHRYLPKD